MLRQIVLRVEIYFIRVVPLDAMLASFEWTTFIFSLLKLVLAIEYMPCVALYDSLRMARDPESFAL